MHREILPTSPILPAHGDSLQLMEELAAGEIDAAVDVLPVNDDRVCVEVRDAQPGLHDVLLLCVDTRDRFGPDVAGAKRQSDWGLASTRLAQDGGLHLAGHRQHHRGHSASCACQYTDTGSAGLFRHSHPAGYDRPKLACPPARSESSG
jgi:hypothetical protein